MQLQAGFTLTIHAFGGSLGFTSLQSKLDEPGAGSGLWREFPALRSFQSESGEVLAGPGIL
jgi:hypothetical protein